MAGQNTFQTFKGFKPCLGLWAWITNTDERCGKGEQLLCLASFYDASCRKSKVIVEKLLYEIGLAHTPSAIDSHELGSPRKFDVFKHLKLFLATDEILIHILC